MSKFRKIDECKKNDLKQPHGRRLPAGRKIRTILVAFSMALLLCVEAFTVYADPDIDELTDERDETQEELDEVNATIEELAMQQEEVEENIEEISCALVQVMAELDVVQIQIEEKEQEIVEAEQLYNEAVAEEEEQYEAMKVRIRYLYESGNQDLISIYLETGNIAQALVKADYVEDLYEYDRRMLGEYQETVQRVADLQVQLANEKEELIALQTDYELQQTEMEQVIAELQIVSDDFEAQIESAQQQASTYAQQLAAQNAEINRIQEEQRRAAEEAARLAAEEAARQAAEEAERQAAAQAAADAAREEANAAALAASEEARQNALNSMAEAAATGTVTTTNSVTYDVSSIYAANGSDLGKAIAVYACQFIGNPYVAGGTSLTNGADCSGFVFSVYRDFGYTIPRNSYSLRSAGTEVSYADAQPGDILCYPGHVALYIGNGLIVHASTEKTGIKVSNALYRGVLTVRRIV